MVDTCYNRFTIPLSGIIGLIIPLGFGFADTNIAIYVVRRTL